MDLNATSTNMTNLIGDTNTTDTITIPAQNATFLGTTNINGTIGASVSIPAQNATLITTNGTETTTNTITIPAQNATLLASSQVEEPTTNSTEICEIIKLNPAVESCTPNILVGL